MFTHDVVFLHDLLAAAQQLDIPVTNRGLRAITERTGIVSEDLPWSIQSAVERLEKLTKRIKTELVPKFNAGDDDPYWEAVRQFYDDYRSILEQSIEEIVCCRCVMRYRNEVKTQSLKTISVFSLSDGEELSRLHKRSCDHITAHHRSSVRGISIPSPEDLRDDADALARVLNDLRSRQAAQRTSPGACAGRNRRI